jgi:type 1 fimbria pilin
MKISSRALGAVAASVVAAALWSPMALAAASFGPGGTITFKGTIVAPPYDIASYVLDNYQGFHTEKLGVKHESTIDVTFTPAPDTSLAARAQYSVGHAGGTLSIVGGAPTERAVTVLVSYD